MPSEPPPSTTFCGIEARALNEFSISQKSSWTSENTGATYPAVWEIDIFDSDTHLIVTPDFSNQELYDLRSISGSYWEGSVSIKGSVGGKSVTGKGYVELVGYEKALKQELPD